MLRQLNVKYPGASIVVQSNVLENGNKKILFATKEYDYVNNEFDRNNLIMVTFDVNGIPIRTEKLLNVAQNIEKQMTAV